MSSVITTKDGTRIWRKGLHPSNEAWLSIGTQRVLSLIESGDPSWESMVPPKVAQLIQSKGLFGVKVPQSV